MQVGERFEKWKQASRQKEAAMRSRYVNLFLGLGPVALGLVVGWLIPVGQGNAVVFGLVIGIIVGYLLVYSRPGRKMHLWITSPAQSNEQHLTADLDQRVIDANTQGIREQAILDAQRMGELREHF